MYYYSIYIAHYFCSVVCYGKMTMKSGLFNELLILVPKLVYSTLIENRILVIFLPIVNGLNNKYI